VSLISSTATLIILGQGVPHCHTIYSDNRHRTSTLQDLHVKAVTQGKGMLPGIEVAPGGRLVLVASKNPSKVNAVQSAMKSCFPRGVTVVRGACMCPWGTYNHLLTLQRAIKNLGCFAGMESASGVSDQPIGDDETLQGYVWAESCTACINMICICSMGVREVQLCLRRTFSWHTRHLP
jgi:hypothetical protein